MRIIVLLEQKNHYLEKFYSFNEEKLNLFLNGNFEEVEAFYDIREKIIETIRYIDSEIQKLYHGEPELENASDKDRVRVKSALKIKNQYVSKIIEQDIQILSCIESAKNAIIRELQELRKGKKAVSGYKSPTFSKKIHREV